MQQKLALTFLCAVITGMHHYSLIFLNNPDYFFSKLWNLKSVSLVPHTVVFLKHGVTPLKMLLHAASFGIIKLTVLFSIWYPSQFLNSLRANIMFHILSTILQLRFICTSQTCSRASTSQVLKLQALGTRPVLLFSAFKNL